MLRAELREPVAALVRRLVRELAREEFDRIAATLDAELEPAAEMLAGECGAPQESTPAPLEALGPPQPSEDERTACRSCGEPKPLEAFDTGRRECRACRARRKRE